MGNQSRNCIINRSRCPTSARVFSFGHAGSCYRLERLRSRLFAGLTVQGLGFSNLGLGFSNLGFGVLGFSTLGFRV